MRALGRTLVLSVIAAASWSALVPASASALSDYTWSGLQGAIQGQSQSNLWSQNNWTTPSPTMNQSVGTIAFPDLGHACASSTPATTCYGSLADVPGINANALTIDDIAPYNISAEPGISLGVGGGGLTAAPASSPTAPSGFGPEIRLPLALTANQTWSVTGNGFPVVGGLNLNKVTGSGSTLGIALSNQAGLYFQSFDVGSFTATGANPSDAGINAFLNATIQAADLNGTDGNPVTLAHVRYSLEPNLNPNLPHTATVGPLSSVGASLVIGDGYAPDGVLSVNGGVTLDSATQTFMFIDKSGGTPSTDYSQLSATGNVALGGLLSLAQGGTTVTSDACSLAVGSTATLVSTSGTISGTFRNAPDGAIVPLSQGCIGTPLPLAARITYSSHTVTATVMSASATSTTLSSNPSSAVTDQLVTLTATITTGAVSPSGPAGTVAFMNATTALGGCASQAVSATSATSGTATCTTSFSASGSPASLTATFTPSGGGGSSASTSAPVSLTIGPDPTATTIAVSNANPAAGQSVTYTATVTPTNTGSAAVTGSVQFTDGGAMITGCVSQPITAAGQATCTTQYSTGGSHAITANYSGDGNFSSSASAATPVNVTAPGTSPGASQGTAHVGVPRLTGTSANVPLSCFGTATCTVQLSLTVTETIKNGRVTAVTARRTKTKRRHVTVASARVTIQVGRSVTVALRLNAAGRRLLTQRRRLATRLSVTQLISGKTPILATRTLTFLPAAKHKRKHGK